MKINARIICNCSASMRIIAAIFLIWISAKPTAFSQGTITFNQTPGYVESYYEQGFWFQVVPSDPPQTARMLIDPNGRLVFSPGWEGYYVSFSLTDGGTFGLASVDLKGDYYNGTTVQFNGHFGDGSLVSSSFIVPYDFQINTYQFGSEFSSDLVRVDLLLSHWAMDNLAYLNVVPEPSVISLILLGSGIFIYVRRRNRR